MTLTAQGTPRFEITIGGIESLEDYAADIFFRQGAVVVTKSWAYGELTGTVIETGLTEEEAADFSYIRAVHIQVRLKNSAGQVEASETVDDTFEDLDISGDIEDAVIELTLRMTDLEEALQFDAEGTVSKRKTLNPTKIVRKYIYNVNTKTPYGPQNSYMHHFYDVTEQNIYYITGSTPSNTNGHPLATFYNAAGDLLEKVGTDPDTTYTDYAVTAPEGAYTMVVNKTNASINISVSTDAMQTGSKVIDNMQSSIDKLQENMVNVLERLGEEEDAIQKGETMDPTETAEGLYHVINKTVYSGPKYSHAFYDVEGLKWYFVSGSAASNINSYPLCAFYDNEGNYLDSFGTDANTIYKDLLVQAPNGAVTLVVNKAVLSATIIVKQGIESSDEESEAGYSLSVADALIRAEKRNPFRLAELDKGYVTFVVDDLLTDLDSIASIFEEYGYPFGIAAISDRLDIQATYLQEARGNFTPGMTMRQIMAQVVANGGEIMTHNSAPVVSVDNQDDYNFMKGYFVTSKKNLENAGFTIRGIIRAGGTGAISGTKQIERWLIGNYEYSNMGTAENYTQERITIQKDNETIKQLIKQAYDNKTWLRWMVHGYDFGGGQTFTGESDLREILKYCQTIGIPVVTYAHMFDNFSSSELLEFVKKNS